MSWMDEGFLGGAGQGESALQQMIEAAVRGASAGEVAAVEPARDVNITLELDRQQFARAVYRFNNEESRRVGARLAEGGDY